jgi:hypothetical protein
MVNDFISLQKAIPLFPARPHRNTVIRWANRGIDGVKLMTVRFGGKRLTRPVWVEEFCKAVMGTSPEGNAAPSIETSATHNAAEDKLDAMGIS